MEGSISNAPKSFWWAKLIPKFVTPLIAKYLQANKRHVASKVITLSSFIENKKITNINLLKIDCEGEEVNVLRGIKKKHWTLIDTVIMEANDIKNNIEIYLVKNLKFIKNLLIYSVLKAGLEPARDQISLPPQDSVYTSSTTSALNTKVSLFLSLIHI